MFNKKMMEDPRTGVWKQTPVDSNNNPIDSNGNPRYWDATDYCWVTKDQLVAGHDNQKMVWNFQTHQWDASPHYVDVVNDRGVPVHEKTGETFWGERDADGIIWGGNWWM